MSSKPNPDRETFPLSLSSVTVANAYHLDCNFSFAVFAENERECVHPVLGTAAH